MEIEIKSILKKIIVKDDKVKVERLEIANDEITEIRYQMATVWIQGFITFCTEKGGQKVHSLNDATLNKNSITFYYGNNEKVEEILNHFSEKVKLTEFTDIKKEKKSKTKEIVCCPKWESTQITANKRGFSLGKAILRSTISLGVGLIAGGIGKNKIEITCLRCGYRWKAGKK